MKGEIMKSYQKQKMNEIATYYFIYKNHFNVMSFSSGEYDYESPYYQYYRDVEIVFSHLNDDERLIIVNDFFESAPIEWWKKIYKKNEYLNQKRKAINHFLRLFDEIH